MLRSSCSLLSGSGPPPRTYSVVIYSLWWLCHVRKAASAAATVTRIPSFVSSTSRFCVRHRTSATVVLPPASAKWRDGSSAAVNFKGGERFRSFSLRSENRRHPDDGGGDVAAIEGSVRTASTSLLRVLGHGDFAGLTANFHWPSGDLMEVPQHLVPKAMVEWGQVPTCLEVLTSEFDDEEGGNEARNSTASPRMTRQTITVLPSIGCAVDNLETMKSTVQAFEDSSVLTVACQSTSDDATCWPVRVTTYWPANHMDRRRIVVEATFPVAHPLSVGVVGDVDSEWDGHRVRVSVPLEVTDANGIPSVQPSSPVSITCERMVSEESSRGTLADGGGLDGQSVSRMLGPFLRQSYNAFDGSANDPLTPIADYIKEESSSDRDRAKEELEMLALPCNTILSLSRGIEDFQLSIGHVDSSTTSGIAADTVESFVHKVLHIRVPLMERNHSDESTSLDPTAFEFAAQVDLTNGDNAR